MSTALPIRERIEANCTPEPNSGCWLWLASLNASGYGQLMTGSRKDGTKRPRLAHRLSYEAFRGPIPDGLSLDHLCRVHSCVNPWHLEPVTTRENIVRGVGPKILADMNRRKTYCPAGHLYDGANLYITPKGHRQCRTCLNTKKRERRRANG